MNNTTFRLNSLQTKISATFIIVITLCMVGFGIYQYITIKKQSRWASLFKRIPSHE